MITLEQRVEYRSALKQLDDLRNQIEDAIHKKKSLPKAVQIALEKMTGTVELEGQFRAIDAFYSRLDAQYDEELRYAAQFRFSPFCEYMFRNEPPAQHHEFLIEHMEAVHNREIMRLAISLPPGSGKSAYASIRFAAWHLGRRVDDRWLQGAHTQTFAKDRLGKPVRNLITSARYRDVFPERVLSAASSAADYFEFADSSVAYYKAIGVGQGISGFRADIGAIDDPIASREDAESPTMRRKLHEWFEDDFGTRPMPGSPIFIVACIAGDAPITMADGSWKRMDAIRAGDKVMSLGDDGLTTETVTAFIPQGRDRIYEVIAGPHTIRGNARHPILVSTPEGNVWRRISELRVGDYVVAGYQTDADKCDMDPEEAWVLGYMTGSGIVEVTQNGKKKKKHYVTRVLDNPENVQRVLDYFKRAYGADFDALSHGYYRSTNSELGKAMARWGLTKPHQRRRVDPRIFSAAREARDAFLEGYAAAAARRAEDGEYSAYVVGTFGYQIAQDIRHLARSVGRRTTAIHTRHRQRPRHYFVFGSQAEREDLVAVPVFKIIDTGKYAKVYDITVTGSETFLVDGVVTHNTRWHEDDLIGHELRKMEKGQAAYRWDVINIPAIAEEDDPLGRKPGEGLWPEVFGTDWYMAKKLDSTPRSWNSLYQGKPAAEEGGILKRADISRWQVPPEDEVDSEGVITKKVIKRRTLSVDCAEKATKRSDWTAATIWYETVDGKHYLIHAARCRKEFVELTQWINELAKAYNVDQILVEDKGAGTQYIQYHKTASNPPAPVIPISTNNNSKQFRFDGVTPMFASGRVFFPESGTDWIADLEDELLKFPNAKHDDYVDSVSQYLNYSRKSGVKRGTRKLISGMVGV